MKAKFVGDPSQPNEVVPDEFQAFGVVFPKGKYVDVPARYASKFQGNNHFDVKGAEEAKADPAPLPKHPAVATPDDGAVIDGGKSAGDTK